MPKQTYRRTRRARTRRSRTRRSRRGYKQLGSAFPQHVQNFIARNEGMEYGTPQGARYYAARWLIAGNPADEPMDEDIALLTEANYPSDRGFLMFPGIGPSRVNSPGYGERKRELIDRMRAYAASMNNANLLARMNRLR